MATATETGAVVSDLTPGESRHLKSLEARIERGLRTFNEVGAALLEIRDKRLFRLSYQTFEAYCRERWDLERARAYQLMGAAEVIEALPKGARLVNEAQARELVPLVHSDPKQVGEVWKVLAATDQPVTAPRIREAVRVVTGNGREPEPPTQTDRLITELQRTTALFKVWKTSKPNVGERSRVRKAVADMTAALSA